MRAAAALLSVALPLAAAAHDGVVHQSAEEAAAHRAETAAAPPPPTPELPFPVEIEARFSLIDHTGRAVTEADFRGRTVAIFFGYANCEAICSVALPRLAQAIEAMGEAGEAVTPLVITVDPARDTVETMGPALAKWHPRLVGLTGPEAALAEARAAFQVEAKQVAEGPDGQPIFAHGSFIYLVGPDGRVLTLMPPILGPNRMATIIESYL